MLSDGEDPRIVLERLIAERGENYADLSRLLKRNPAYIQQFIKRGSPRKLDEEDRRVLARYFGVASNESRARCQPLSLCRGWRSAPRQDLARLMRMSEPQGCSRLTPIGFGIWACGRSVFQSSALTANRWRRL
jgi:hypothetical protein